jgi:hypothetical protein
VPAATAECRGELDVDEFDAEPLADGRVHDEP